jgi:hypothetical protein
VSVRYGYLQARIQARYAELPSESLWLHLGALKELASFLEEARSTPLAQWITGISTSSDVREIEQYLRRHLVETIRETASWFDQRWHPAVLWLETLSELPTLDYLRRNDVAPEGKVSEQLLLGVVSLEIENQDLRQAWITAWRSRWPRDSNQNLHGMESLQKTLEHYSILFPVLSVEEAWKSRQDLEFRLRLFFRRHALQPAVAIAYLSLVALCLERLRAELLQRALFPEHGVAS